METPIYIIGSGAVGLTLAVFLKQAGKDVVLLRGRRDSPAETALPITVDLSDGTFRSASVAIRTLDEIDALNGIVLLTIKAFGNADMAQRIKDKIGQSPLVLLQNGLDIEQPFLDAGFPEVYRCVLLATSQIRADYTVSYRPVAASPIGVVRSQSPQLEPLVGQLNTAPFPFRADGFIQRAVWEKVITNCVFNSICPLLNMDNGIFYRNEAALALAREVIDECVAVAAETGIQLNRDEVVSRLLQISQRSAGQLISTLVDMQHGRQTEIDALNLAVAHLAEQIGQGHLATRTRLLGELIKLKSEAG